jgi:hypothetical protein
VIKGHALLGNLIFHMNSGPALLFALLTASRDCPSGLMVCSLNSKTPRHAGAFFMPSAGY